MLSRNLARNVLATLVGFASTPLALAADWPQFGYDAAHSGNNPGETTIGATNVAQLTRRYQVTLPASVDSAPVYASAIETAAGTKNLLFVSATSSGKLIALDAADGAVVWSQGGGNTTTQGSPAIDPDRRFVYNYGADGKVHKYAIGDGSEVTTDGWPQLSTLKPGVEKGASALAIATTSAGTFLYSVTDGYIGDGGDYQGHITTIDLASGAQKVFNTLCSDITVHMVQNGQPGVTDCGERQSGIWGRPGATYDAATDRVYITTGNGLFDANTGGLHWGDSVLALKPDGSGAGAGLPLDSYTPQNYPQLDGQDIDLGSASLSILPVPAESTVQHLGLQTGKDSKLRLIDLDDMSGTGAPGGVGGEIEVIDVPISEFWMKTQPAIWVDPANDHATWVYMANRNGISGLKLTLTGSNLPHLQPTWQKTTDATSAIIANGVLYHAGSCSGGTCLIARDPLTGDVLWTSPTIGSLHWQSPILIDGALYIAAGTRLQRFDLGDGGVTHTVTPSAGANGSIAPDTPQTVTDGASVAFMLTPDAHYAIDNVTGCGGTLAGNVYTTAPVDADCAVDATFAPITHTVTPLPGDAYSVDPSTPQTVIDGGSVAFTITLAPGPYTPGFIFGCPGQSDGNVFTAGPITADCSFSVAVYVEEVIFGDGFDPPMR